MKRSLYFLIYCISFSCFSQESIEVGETNVTLLIFDNPIESEFFSDDEYGRVETSGKENNHILPIKYLKVGNTYKNGELLVVTEGGKMHEFKLTYSKHPKRFIHKIGFKTKGESIIASEEIKEAVPLFSDFSKGIETVVHYTETSVSHTDDEKSRMEAYCKRTQFTKKKILQRGDRKGNIKLILKEVSFYRDALYFHFSLANKGGLSYDISKTFFETNPIIIGETSKNNVEIKPLFTYQSPKRVSGYSTAHFVIVFEKFSLDGYKNLEFNIEEEEGDRDLLLLIDNQLINNPVTLNE